MVTSSKGNVNQATTNRIEHHLHVASAALDHLVRKYSQRMTPMRRFLEKNGTGTNLCFIERRITSVLTYIGGTKLICMKIVKLVLM